LKTVHIQPLTVAADRRNEVAIRLVQARVEEMEAPANCGILFRRPSTRKNKFKNRRSDSFPNSFPLQPGSIRKSTLLLTDTLGATPRATMDDRGGLGSLRLVRAV
jgi:hypothetical protein